MPLFTIDENKCNQDGLCAAECPVGCIVFEKGTVPAPHEKKQAYCLGCGHCVAICPTGAITLEQFPEPAPSRKKALRISKEQAEEFLVSRRSIRAFKDTPISREEINSLLQVTSYSPSGHNARPTKWTVADSPDKVARVAGAVAEWMRREVKGDTRIAHALHLSGIVRAWDNGMDLICRNAPVVAAAYGPQKGITPREDAILATGYLELNTFASGLGACWCGYLIAAAAYDRTVCELLGVPEDHTVYGALMLGRPARKFSAIPPRSLPEVNWI